MKQRRRGDLLERPWKGDRRLVVAVVISWASRLLRPNGVSCDGWSWIAVVVCSTVLNTSFPEMYGYK